MDLLLPYAAAGVDISYFLIFSNFEYLCVYTFFFLQGESGPKKGMIGKMFSMFKS